MYYLEKFQDYLLKERRYAIHTAKSYLRDVEFFFQYAEEDVLAIDQKKIRQWIVFLAKEGLNHKSINRKISSLKAYFKFLYITKTIEKYPLSGIRFLKTEKKIQIPFSEKEMHSVEREHFSKDFEGFTEYMCVMLFYNLGIRKTELIELKIQNFTGNAFKILGKGGKERLVPVSEKLLKSIQEYLLIRKGIKTDEGNDYFFIKKGKKIGQTFVYRLINDYFRCITSKEKRSPHILRHSFATHLIQNGAEINAVKELMGHASLSSTQVYINSNIEELKKIYQKAHPRNQKED